MNRTLYATINFIELRLRYRDIIYLLLPRTSSVRKRLEIQRRREQIMYLETPPPVEATDESGMVHEDALHSNSGAREKRKGLKTEVACWVSLHREVTC